ncbi:MAG: hypothetical protein LBI26_00740 [Holosporales bacterium]|nr:hypothetical protein [Holosporales bacterium]
MTEFSESESKVFYAEVSSNSMLEIRRMDGTISEDMKKKLQKRVNLISDSVLLEFGQGFKEKYFLLFNKVVHSENKEAFYEAASLANQGDEYNVPTGFSVREVRRYGRFKKKNLLKMLNIICPRVSEFLKGMKEDICVKSIIYIVE